MVGDAAARVAVVGTVRERMLFKNFRNRSGRKSLQAARIVAVLFRLFCIVSVATLSSHAMRWNSINLAA